MAGVFLSYDRDDADKARLVARALEGAGHSVWWDLHVRGGTQFSQVIEEALKAADAVVVLWSANSIQSAWVRDEAAVGRDSGRLIPVSLDRTEPPLGFRQFQTIEFTRWKGRRQAAEFRELQSAIASLAGQTASTAPQPISSTSGRRRWRPLHAIAGAAIALLLAAALAGWLMRHSDAPVVAVRAVESSPESQSLARDLFVKLGRLQAADPDGLQIVDAAGPTKPDFIFQVSGSSAAGHAAANLALVGRDRTLLWSKDFERPQAEYSDLKQQLALTTARVLGCATEAVTNRSSKLDQRTLKLYLSGCASLSDLAWTDFRGLVPTFREVTRRVPRFEGGWAKLVETEAYVMGWESIPADSPEGRTLKVDVASARKLNPRMAEAYWAEWVLLGEAEVDRSAGLVERATRDNPDDPLILGIRATFLSRVGRVNEALEIAKRGAELSPLAGDAAAGYVIALGYAGQLDAALQELEKAEKIWPGTRTLTEARFRLHLRYGDPKEALRIVRSGVNPEYARFERFLVARIDPTKENIDRAIADARAQVAQSPRGTGWFLLTLAQFGREEEIYSALERLPKTRPVYAAEMFFRPDFHRFRQDVRFMMLAKNLGLVDYWRSSGKWPDFCFEHDLPYDCKEEAARLS